MYDWSVLSLSLHLRLSCTGKWLFEASPGNPQSELVHMPHGLHFNLDHPNYIQIWCKSTLSSSFDAVRESETEAAPWPVISIIIGSPWKYPSSCGILVHMNEMRYFFPFPSQSLPLSVVFLSLLTQTFFFFLNHRFERHLSSYIDPSSHVRLNTLTRILCLSLVPILSAKVDPGNNGQQRHSPWCLAMSHSRHIGQNRPQKPVNNHIKESRGSQMCSEQLHVSKTVYNPTPSIQSCTVSLQSGTENE